MDTAVIPQKKQGRFATSYQLAKESFSFLRKDPEMLWFPILEMLAGIAFLAIVAAAGYVAYQNGMLPSISEGADGGEAPLTYVEYMFMAVVYLGLAFIGAMGQGAIVAVAHKRMQGIDPTFKDGARAVFERLPALFLWAVFTATVGVVLRFIGERLGWLGKLFDFAGQVAWSLLTFFIVPVLVIEKQPVPASIRRSAGIFKQRWGEALITSVGLGAFFGALMLGVILLFGGLLIVSVIMESFVTTFILFIAMLGSLLVLGLVQGTLSTVFKTVLYEYAATGIIPSAFSPELVTGAFQAKGKA